MASTDIAARRIERTRFGIARLDYVLIVAVIALLLLGLMMVYSTTFDWSQAETGSPTAFFLRQVMWVALGLFSMVVLSRIDYIWWRRLAVPVMGVALVLLALVLAFGSTVFGAQRTFLDGSVQPSEPAKLAIVIYIAAWLSSKGKKVQQVTYGLIPFSVLIGLIAGLIVLQPDFGTAVLIVLTAGAMFFIAGADLLQMGLACAISAGTFYLLIINSPHAGNRLTQYLEALSNSDEISYHVHHALIALGSGGLFGRGPGAGYEKFGHLPAPHTDSLFAAMGEEMGLAGCLIVVALFALVAQRGFRIALSAREPFGAVLASGITCWLTFQAVINVAVITGLFPFTGIPLPFMSMGGSAMVASLAAIGVLLSVSRGSHAAIATRTPPRPVTATTQLWDSGFSFGVRDGGRKRAGLVFRWRNRRSRVSRVGRR